MSTGSQLKETAPEKPVLRFSPLAWEKIWAITRGNKVNGKMYECSSLGIMAENDPCLVEDIIVVPQKNTGSTTEMDQDKLGEIVVKLHQMGIKPSRLACWHHTHADFSVFWSGTDLATIERYAADGIQWSVVTSTKDGGSILVRADMFKPFRTHFDNCQYKIDYDRPDVADWTEKALALMDNQTTTYKGGNSYPSYPRYNGGYNNNYRGNSHSGSSTKGGSKSKKEEKREVTKERLAKTQEAVDLLDQAFEKNYVSADEAKLLATSLLDGTTSPQELINLISKRVHQVNKAADEVVETAEKEAGVVKTEGASDEATKVLALPDPKDEEEISVAEVEETTTTKAALTQPAD